MANNSFEVSKKTYCLPCPIETVEENYEKMLMVKREVIDCIKINSLFNLLSVLPLTYLGNYDFLFEV